MFITVCLSLFFATLATAAAVIYLLAIAFRPDVVGPTKLTNAALRKILLVIAHPDDECMFFAPTITNLTEELEVDVHLLCLSVGNFDKLGVKRREELMKSCVELGVNRDNVKVLDDRELQDGPKEHWPVRKIAEIVENYVAEHSIDTIITFDERGISGHPNHIACHEGIRFLLKSHSKTAASSVPSSATSTLKAVYTLTTVRLVRKYLSVLDLGLSSAAMDVLPFGSTTTGPSLLRSLSRSDFLKAATTSSTSSTSSSSTSRKKGSALPTTPTTPISNVPLAPPPSLLFVSGRTGWARGVQAMRWHRSQWVWFRQLYVLFSRYMVFNELKKMEV